MNISEKILKLRKEKGLSQEAFAEILGVSRQSVSKWESNGALPDIDKIIAMSKLFGVSTDYLLKDEETETPDTEAAPMSEEATAVYYEVQPQPESPKTDKKKTTKKIVAIILAVLIAASAIIIPLCSDKILDAWYELNGGKIN